jgi:hypothetical protein
LAKTRAAEAGFGRVADLVIAPAAACRLQPVQCALAGQLFIQIPLADQRPRQRIREKLLLIAKVFISQRQPMNSLRHHL